MTTSTIREVIQSTIDQMDNSVPQKIKKQAQAVALKIYEQQIPAAQALQITPKDEETIYKHGYQLFQGGKYREAMGCFFFLKDLQPTSYQYAFALAATYQYLKEYAFAAATYMECMSMDLENPAPYFHLYDCFLKLNQPLSALHAITSTISLAQKKTEYKELLARAQLEYNRLVEELKKQTQSSKMTPNKGGKL